MSNSTDPPRPAGPCRIIRLCRDYGGALMVTPPDGDPAHPETRCFRLAAWEIGRYAPLVLHEIPFGEARTWGFCGISDGMGFEELPKDPFPSLADAVCFILAKHMERLAEALADPSPANGMRSVRVEPEGSNAVRIDIVCGCGRNGLQDETVKHGDFRHRIDISGSEKTLICECGARYRLRPQRDHVHIDVIADGE